MEKMVELRGVSKRFGDFVAVAVGAFADPGFPAPRISVYEERKHGWVTLPDGLVIE